MVSDPAKQVLAPREERSKRRRSRYLNERDDLPATDKLKVQHMLYQISFHDQSNPKFNYYLGPRDGNPVRSAINLAAFAYWYIYIGLSPSSGTGYDTVSTSSLYDRTRLKTDCGVVFLWWLFAGGGSNRWTSEFNLYVLSASCWVTHHCKFCVL